MPPETAPILPPPASNRAAAPRPLWSFAVRQAVLPMILLAAFVLPLPGADGHLLGLPTLCVFRLLTGIPCPGCGLTRSCVCLAHGRLGESVAYHPLGPLTFAVMIALVLRRLPLFRRLVVSPGVASGLAGGAAALFLLVWAARLIYGPPGYL